jgi:hypothetical protein
MEKNIGKAVLAGFVATVVMTMMMYMAPMMGIPKMDVAGMLSGMMKTPWIVGMLIHFMNGALIFPLIYVFVFHNILPGPSFVKGMTWGLILFLIAQVMVMPMAGAGVFSSNSPNPLLSVMGSFMGHAVYGAILGMIYG